MQNRKQVTQVGIDSLPITTTNDYDLCIRVREGLLGRGCELYNILLTGLEICDPHQGHIFQHFCGMLTPQKKWPAEESEVRVWWREASVRMKTTIAFFDSNTDPNFTLSPFTSNTSSCAAWAIVCSVGIASSTMTVAEEDRNRSIFPDSLGVWGASTRFLIVIPNHHGGYTPCVLRARCVLKCLIYRVWRSQKMKPSFQTTFHQTLYRDRYIVFLTLR